MVIFAQATALQHFEHVKSNNNPTYNLRMPIRMYATITTFIVTQ